MGRSCRYLLMTLPADMTSVPGVRSMVCIESLLTLSLPGGEPPYASCDLFSLAQTARRVSTHERRTDG